MRTVYSHGKDTEERQVFRRAVKLKTGTEDAKVKCWARPFQLRAAATGSVHSPTSERHQIITTLCSKKVGNQTHGGNFVKS